MGIEKLQYIFNYISLVALNDHNEDGTMLQIYLLICIINCANCFINFRTTYISLTVDAKHENPKKTGIKNLNNHKPPQEADYFNLFSPQDFKQLDE